MDDEASTDVVYERIGKKRKLKWKSIWKHVPLYSRFCNTFVANSMISSVLQICVVDLFLLVMLLFVKKRITLDTYDAGFADSDAVLYCSFITILLGLPSTGLAPFQLYRRSKGGKDLCQVHRTAYLALCEFIVILEIPYLFVFLYNYIAQLYHIDIIYRNIILGGHPSIYIVLMVIERLLAYYAYVLCWYQLILFNRMRDHALFQRGIYPSCRTYAKAKPDRAFSKKGKAIETLKFEIYQAANTGNTETAQLAIDRAIKLDGADFARRWYTCQQRFFGFLTRSARNPLHVACALGNASIVQLLLDHGWDINMMDKVIWSGLELPDVYNRMFGLLYFLRNIHYSHQASSKLGQSGWFVSTLLSPLHVACAMEEPDLVRLLLRHGAEVNICAISNRRKEATPPIYWTRYPECASLLIRADANHLYVPGRGFYLTPLQAAVLDDRLDVANRIQQWGGDIALTPLHRACASGDLKKVTSLLHLGTDPNVLGEHSRGIFRRTPMHWAAMRGKLSAVKLLYEHGALLDERDSTGRTPLTWACYHNRTVVVNYLIKCGANACSIDNQSRNIAIFIAQVEGIDTTIFKALKLAGLDINAPKCNGDTPLHVAIKHGHRSTAVSLLRAGADMMTVNNDGLRAIDCTSASDLQYAIKKEAGNRDIMISYSHSRTEFAVKIREALEQNNITTWFDHIHPSGIGGGAEWREEIARGIMNASVVLCILSEEYPKSHWCMKELALAKQYGKTVVAISCEDCELTDELQVYLYARQIINFDEAITGRIQIDKRAVEFQYDSDLFDVKLRLLLDGLRDQIELQRVNSEQVMQSNTPDGVLTRSFNLAQSFGSNEFVFISHGDCHLSFSQELKTSLQMQGVSCFLDTQIGYVSPDERTRAAKDAILHCSAFLVILSSVSSSNSILSDQLAFAEDRGKKIVPILLSAPTLPLGKQYTLSVNRVFHFAQGFGYEDSFETLYEELSSLNVRDQSNTSSVVNDWKVERILKKDS